MAYGDLRAEFDPEYRIVLRELAIYDDDEPPPAYGLDTEIKAIAQTAERAGFERFHLVGFSAGGAASVAFAARHGDRLVSLSLLEPAWLGNADMSEAERRSRDESDAAMALPPQQAMSEFIRMNLAPGVEPPPSPPGDPPAWMAKRPAALRVIDPAFRKHDLDTAALRELRCPVLYVLGGLSNPDIYAAGAERAKGLFADFTLEVFPDRHHFSPPHRAEPARLAKILRRFWARAESLV